MDIFSLKFLDPGLEKDYIETKRLQSAKTYFLLYSFVTFLQLLGLFLIISTEETPLSVLIIWTIVPIATLISTQILIKKSSFYELALFLQKMEMSIYIMEVIFMRLSVADDRLSFFIGLIANCLNLRWGDARCWYFIALEIIISYTYYFVRIKPELIQSSYGSVFLFLLVICFFITNYFFEEKRWRHAYYKNYRLGREKLFWRNFMENTYNEPGFIVKVANNKRKNNKLAVKSLLSKSAFKKTSDSVVNSNLKLIKKPEFSLGLCNSASRDKLSIFTKEDLVELFRSSDLISSDSKNSQTLQALEEALSHLTQISYNSSNGGYMALKNNPQKNENIRQFSTSYYMSFNKDNKTPFKRARVYLGLMSGTKSSKAYEILVTIHVVEYEEELERLKELDKAKDKILANVTHDLRSPLNGILNFIDQAMETQNQDERNKILEYAKINSDLLLNLINDILDFSQYKEGKLRICVQNFGVIRIAEEVLKLMEFKAESKGIKLILSTTLKEEKFCESDPKRLKQVLINLISNSLKFTNKGVIRLVISQTIYKNVLKFEIIDTGCGIKKDMLNKLFDPYVTFSEAGNNNYGIGLGLSICQSIVQMLGPSEKIFISSIYGKGTKIGFLFFTNAEKANSLPKNSINLSEKSVTISKDSAIYVTTGQRVTTAAVTGITMGGSPGHQNKGTPNFVKSTLNVSSKIESSIFSKFQRSAEKKKEEQNGEETGNTKNNIELRGDSQTKSMAIDRSGMPGVENVSPTMVKKRPSTHKKPRGLTTIMENWGINRTMTIRNSDMRISEFPQRLVGQSSGNNSSSFLSKSIKLNCSEYFTSFTLDSEFMQGFEVVHNGKSYEFLPESKSAREDSAMLENVNVIGCAGGPELEEFDDGRSVNKPSFFFKEETVSFFSSESENRNLNKEPKSDTPIMSNNNSNNSNNSKNTHNMSSDHIIDIENNKTSIDQTIMKKEQLVVPFGEKSLALKNLALEKIEEDAMEEAKQDIKSCSKKPRIRGKKAYTFLERTTKIPTCSSGSSKNSLNVLVVDDDPFNTMIICRFLEKLHLPINIERGCNGQEALDSFKAHNRKNESLKPFHIIFLDCQMPIMNGYEAAKNIKECIKSGGYENCIVIAITAYNIQDEEEKCLLAGMDAILMKPVSEWEFRDLVNQFLIYEATHSEIVH